MGEEAAEQLIEVQDKVIDAQRERIKNLEDQVYLLRLMMRVYADLMKSLIPPT